MSLCTDQGGITSVYRNLLKCSTVSLLCRTLQSPTTIWQTSTRWFLHCVPRHFHTQIACVYCMVSGNRVFQEYKLHAAQSHTIQLEGLSGW